MCRRSFHGVRVVVNCQTTKRNGGSEKSKPPLQMGVSNGLLYDGFFSFAVVRQDETIYRCGALSECLCSYSKSIRCTSSH